MPNWKRTTSLAFQYRTELDGGSEIAFATQNAGAMLLSISPRPRHLKTKMSVDFFILYCSAQKSKTLGVKLSQ